MKQNYSQVEMPKFDNPHFYDARENFISFKEMFRSTILGNENLPDIEKLQYLHSSICGNAANLI